MDAILGIGWGAAVLPALVGVLVPVVGWHGAYVALGAIAVPTPWPLTFAMLKERRDAAKPRHPAVASGAYPQGLSFAQARATRTFQHAGEGFFVLGAASAAVVVHLVRVLLDCGLTATQAAA